MIPIPGTAPLVLRRIEIPADWIDYNGHMNESRYLEACGITTDALLDLIGAGPDYVAAGRSYFTAETHLIHLDECRLGDQLTGSVLVLGHDAKRLHVFVFLERDGRPVATVEQMLLHVDLSSRRTCPADAVLLNRLAALAEVHDRVPRPAAAGRRIAMP